MAKFVIALFVLQVVAFSLGFSCGYSNPTPSCWSPMSCRQPEPVKCYVPPPAPICKPYIAPKPLPCPPSTCGICIPALDALKDKVIRAKCCLKGLLPQICCCPPCTC